MLLKSKKIIAILTSITLIISLSSMAFAEQPSAPPDGFGGGSMGEPPSAPPEGGMGGPGGGQNVTVSWSGATEITSAATETGKTYNSATANENALLIDTNEAVNLTDITVSKTGDSDGGDASSFYGTNAGILVKGGSTTTITGANITTDAMGANGVFSYGGNGAQNGAAGDGTTVNISDTTIHTTGNGSGGIMTTGGGVTNANNLTVVTEGGSSAPIRTDRGGGTVTVTGGSYTSNGLGSPAIYSTADITVNNAELTSNLSEGVCIEGKNSVALNNVNLTANNTQMNGNATFMDTIMIYQSMSGDADSGTSSFTATGGTINSKNGHVFHVTNTNAVINLNGVTINNSDSENILLSICDDGWSGAGNIATLNANGQTLSGNILVGSNSTFTLNLNNSSAFTGTVSGNITNAKDQTVSETVGTINVALDETSKWILTADTYVSSFSGNAANVITNGYTLYVNGTALSGTTAVDTAKNNITVSINGNQVDFSIYDNVLPYIENDRTLVPIRALAENMGFTVDWADETRTVTVKDNNTEIVLTIDSDIATVNGETYTLDVPARITSDRTFIPLRFVSENMGATVNWNDADRSITITKNNGGQRGNQGGFGDGGQRGGMMPSNDPEIQAVIDENSEKFNQYTFTDEKTGITLEYSLYIPENYDANTSYPLIMFIPDSTGAGKSAKEIVGQYYGANVWVTDEDQKEHPSFVLIPAFSETVVDDNWNVSEQVEAAVNLIESLKAQYNIDVNRLYTTGQSMGCMTSLYLNSKYPDLFAACMFVSGQWEISALTGLETTKFFYITAGGDEKASGGQNEVMAMFDTDGISYTYDEWDAQLPNEEQTTNVEKLLAENKDANMIRFETGTVLNGGSGMEHMASFNYGYKLTAVRSWLFKQIKD